MYFNIDTLLNNSKDVRDNYKTTLKQDEKGIGLYATKPILKNEVIALYKLKVFKKSDYKYPYGGIYIFTVYRKNGEAYKTLIGDLYSGSFPKSISKSNNSKSTSKSKKDINIPYWAPFVNEPSNVKDINSDIDVDFKTTYQNKSFLKSGNILTYKLVATRNIEPGEEITWYYGDDYERDYTVNK